MRELGDGVDWDRDWFTLDEGRLGSLSPYRMETSSPASSWRSTSMSEIAVRQRGLLHPVIPFVTDTPWTTLTGGESLVIAGWPRDSGFRDDAAEREIELVQQVVTEVRRLRADQGLQPGQRVPARLTLDGTALVTHHPRSPYNAYPRPMRRPRLGGVLLVDWPRE